MNNNNDSILLVEDDLHLRDGLQTLLSIQGYSCVSAASGEQALEILEQQDFSLFLLDVSLPGLDGFELCKMIRQRDTIVPIVFLTARGSELDCLMGFNQGADHYITKPFRSSELVARIQAILARANLQRKSYSEKKFNKISTQQTQVSLFTLRDIVINSSLLTAERGNQVISLTKRELSVLQLLYKQKNQVVSRDELMDHCWGRQYLPQSRALDQFISALRKKIEINQTNPEIIKTVHSVGYCYQE